MVLSGDVAETLTAPGALACSG